MSSRIDPAQPLTESGLTTTPRIATKLQPSGADRAAVVATAVDPESQLNDHFDYSKVVVNKPWGYEYLVFENAEIAIWILFIAKRRQTSMHCHVNKKTSITVLSGEAICSTLEEEIIRRPGQVMLIGEGVFHRTTSVSESGTFVMEIESPVNKRDLVRYRDDYGRECQGYETVEHMSANVRNYNYVSFIDPQVYYNARTRVGQSTLYLGRFDSGAQLRDYLATHSWDTIALLGGKVVNAKAHFALRTGDLMAREQVDEYDAWETEGAVEAIVVRTSDTHIRLSDFAISHLRKRGIGDFIFVNGAANAHMVDAVGRDTQASKLCLQSEQAATIAAEAYAKLTSKPCAVIVSSGASAIASLAGVANAWVDSTPMLVLSGQSRSTELSGLSSGDIRQLANKDLAIVPVVRTLTKHAAQITDPRKIRQELDRAVGVAVADRHGPVWLDIPIDIQGMNIDEKDLVLGTANGGTNSETRTFSDLDAQVERTIELLRNSERPVILAGFGIRATGAQAEFLELAESLSVPVLTSRRGIDIVPDDFRFYFGRPGTYGHRSANFIIQNSDLLISVGSRLSLPLIGRNYRAFARAATKVVIDIDEMELSKNTLHIDLPIVADARVFIDRTRTVLSGNSFHRPQWVERCQRWRDRFPAHREWRDSPSQAVNPYRFVSALSQALNHDAIIVVDGGPILDYVMQAFKVKRGQRVISSPGLEHQGFALAGAIGACFASKGQRIICLCGRKGFQLNIAEIQTVVNNNLPITIFLCNSRVNADLQQLQASYFGSRYIGLESGASLGSLNKLGDVFGITTAEITDGNDLTRNVNQVLSAVGPVLCEIRLPDDQEIVPRLSMSVTSDGRWMSRPLEDMYPYLDRSELMDNMIIEALGEA